ncbi:unnamed protein product [Rodentolepis nana]|uniref:LAMA4 n=1 Tax=Rodentolepis nana TaxID=102285 RepID=A0A158QJ37_RODNA|nr:unnamed protein product [Rodentolepis nana]
MIQEVFSIQEELLVDPPKSQFEVVKLVLRAIVNVCNSELLHLGTFLFISKTGVCKKCLFGTAGEHCEKCLPGYRRNVKKADGEGAAGTGVSIETGETEMTTYARGCQPCYCDPLGTQAMSGGVGGLGECDEETGQCPCKPGVTGLRCDRCRDGFYGFESGKDVDNQGQWSLHSSSSMPNIIIIIDITTTATFHFSDMPYHRHHDIPFLCLSYPLRAHFNTIIICFNLPQGCTACECSPKGSKSETCDSYNGNCFCLPFAMGRMCDECQAGYFNLTTGIGCQDCGCHPYGSLHRQCNPEGQCPCRSFASGKKCDQCEENRYDLSAGCLPCPPCYNLVQKHVNDLRKKLGDMFGSGPSPDASNNSTELYDQIKMLNQTIQDAYKAALQNSLVGSAITNAEQLESTFNDLLGRAKELTKELDRYISHKPACMRPDLPQRLDTLRGDLDKLGNRIQTEGQKELANFEAKVTASGNRDGTLTEQARNATETIKELQEDASILRETVQDIDTTLRTIEFDAEKLAQNTHAAFQRLNLQLNRLKDVMAMQKGSLKEKIDTVQFLTLEQRQRLSKLFDALAKVPDVSAEHVKLENAFGDWTEALNKLRGIDSGAGSNDLLKAFCIKSVMLKSLELQKMFEEESKAMEGQLDELRQGRDRLRAALARQAQFADRKVKVIERLEQLLNKSETAVQTAQKSVDDAKQSIKDLQDFDAYIDQTKQELESMDDIKKQISEDLDKIDKQVQGIHVQIDDALSAAQVLQTTVASYSDEIKKLKEDKRIRKSAVLILYMRIISCFLLANTSPDETPEGDGAARFKEIKEEADRMKIDERIEYLRKINRSRVNEMEYMRDYELKEFAANTKHLTRILDLLPLLNHQRCFYSGKNIEGSRRRKKRSLDNNSTTDDASFELPPLEVGTTSILSFL